MAQFWIVGGGGVGLVVSPQRIPRRLATGCALHGASLSLVWPRESNQREGHPDIRVSLRETALPPVPLRGPAYKGRRGPLSLSPHPCGSSPYATPALGLLTGTVARTKLLRLIVPTLRVGTPLQTLRVCGTRSVPRWVPTQSVGTIGVCTAIQAGTGSRQEAEWSRRGRGMAAGMPAKA